MFLIALHELVEAHLCLVRGIPQEEVDAFDLKVSNDNPDVEPGDEWGCPYREEHRFAMIVEHLVAHELGIGGWGHIS
jgi:hypothetical protein